MAVQPKPPRGTIYICGRVMTWPVWRFVGAFTQEADAIGCCLDAHYFVAPAKMNKRFPDTIDKWPGMKYPRGVDEAA